MVEEQSFHAHYTLELPKAEEREIELRYTYIVGPKGQKYLHQFDPRFPTLDEGWPETIEYLRSKGVEITEDRRTERYSERIPLKVPMSSIVSRLKEETKGGGRADVYPAHGFATIETPTRFGITEHNRRRRILQAWLEENGIEYKVKCSTLHSKNVCELVTRPPA